jgi:ornithine cyclodeaminase
MLILTEPEIRELVDADAARTAMADAFRALHLGAATLASVISLPFGDPVGVAHIKAGHVHSDSVWTAKVSADFYPENGNGTVHSGLMLVLSSVDGALASVLLDNGYLTELRTGGAGALAADILSRADSTNVAIVGAGNQARYQLEALLRVRPIDDVRIASRTRSRADEFAKEIVDTHSLRATVFDSIADAIHGADIVLTTTPSPEPLIQAEWLEPGVHVTAVGSDEPTKQELDPMVLARADIVAVDDPGQAARIGELHHAIDAGVRGEADVVSLGALVVGATAGRAREEDITVADLTGVGVQDAAIAALVLRRAVSAESVRLTSASDAGTVVPAALGTPE